MAKKKSTRRGKSAQDEEVGLFDGTDDIQFKPGTAGSLMTPTGSDGSIIGVPIPFVLQYIIDCPVWEYGTTSEVNGFRQSHKTALIYELARLFKPLGGQFRYINTEGKFSENYAHSTIGWDNASRAMSRFYGAGSLNVAEKLLLDCVKAEEARTLLKNKIKKQSPTKPVGWDRPMLLALDSISGVNTDEHNAKIEATGSAGRGYSTEALSVTKYMKCIANKIPSYPAVLIFTRHRKEDPAEEKYAANKTRLPGGQHLGFQIAHQLVCKQVGASRELNPDPNGSVNRERRVIRITNSKNSAGADRREVEVDLVWYHKTFVVGGAPKSLQVTIWKWEEALVDLLLNWRNNKPGYGDVIQGGKDRSVAGRKERFNHFLHLEEVNRGSHGKFYYSKTLGMAKDDAVKKQEMGFLIEQDRDAITGLRLMFGIKPGHVWKPPEDFLQYRNRVLSKCAEDTTKQLTEEQISEVVGDFRRRDNMYMDR